METGTLCSICAIYIRYYESIKTNILPARPKLSLYISRINSHPGYFAIKFYRRGGYRIIKNLTVARYSQGYQRQGTATLESLAFVLLHKEPEPPVNLVLEEKQIIARVTYHQFRLDLSRKVKRNPQPLVGDPRIVS
jgi:hypothetical protein